MSRTKTGIVRRAHHKKVFSITKSFRGANTHLYKRAKEASLHSGMYAYIGRKLRKRDFRKLWIIRISAALKTIDSALNYSRFIKRLSDVKIELNRKMLSEIAVNDFKTFEKIVKEAK